MYRTRRSQQSASYPLTLPGEAAEISKQPYFTQDSTSADLDNHIQNQNEGVSSDDEEDILDGVPHAGLLQAESNRLQAHQEAAPSDGDRDTFDMSLAALSDAVIAPELTQNHHESVRGRGSGTDRGRTRGRGRGRGSLKALLEFEARKRGEPPLESRPRVRRKGPRLAPRGEGQLGAPKGTRRGPKPQVEPTDDFKNLQRLATNAFLGKQYETALQHAIKAIQINPEIFAAHALLSEIYREMGRTEESLMVLWSGAHTQREPGVWWEIANRTSELAAGDEESRDDNLLYCYGRISQIDPADFDARRGRLAIYLRRDQPVQAARECRKMLKYQPSNLEIIQLLAEICVEPNDVSRAIQAYDKAIQHLQLTTPGLATPTFSFSDLNILLDLYVQSNQHAAGLFKLKSVARWLCGRQDEAFWDDYQDDDREWDTIDHPRRTEVLEFRPDNYPSSSYGEGLPVEIRTKMGIFRLHLGVFHLDEAMYHFQHLSSKDESPQDAVHDYPDLFREIADNLFSCKFYSQALMFYEPLLNAHATLDVELRAKMAKSYKETNNSDLAICLYESLLGEFGENAEYLVSLAKLSEDTGNNDKAMEYISKVISLGEMEALRSANLKSQITLKKRPTAVPKKRRLASTENFFQQDENRDSDQRKQARIASSAGGNVADGTVDHIDQEVSTHRARQRRKKKSQTISTTESLQNREILLEKIARLPSLRMRMRTGEESATMEWISLADDALDYFTNTSVFYPTGKNTRFLGYDAEARRSSMLLKPGQPYTESEEIAGRLLGALDLTSEREDDVDGSEKPVSIPQDFCGMRFEEWLDLFCEFAFVAAKQGKASKCYETIHKALKANIFSYNPQRLFHIHMCWLTCCLLLDDEENLELPIRWFIRTYPGATDTYRLYAAFYRLSKGDSNWYQSGPNQKFMFRQVKMIDFALIGDTEEGKKRFTWEQHVKHLAKSIKHPPYGWDSSLDPARGEDRRSPLPSIESLDPVLLTMYGHMLAQNGSYRNALNYYFRAYATDPTNAMVVLSLSVAYVQYAMKRQISNRHYSIVQAVSLMHEYKRLRLASPNEKQTRARQLQEMETEFNQGRLWHQLGLTHLAIHCYERCLALQVHDGVNDGNDVDEDVEMAEEEDHDDDSIDNEPDFKREAAFALQTIYAIAGDFVKARQITEQWLVF